MDKTIDSEYIPYKFVHVDTVYYLCRVTLQYSLTNICSLSSTLVKLHVNLELQKYNDIGEDEPTIAT